MKTLPFLAGALALGLILPAVALGTSVATATIVQAQQAGSGQTGGSVAFVRETGHAGSFEVESGRLALERSQNAGVRGYAGQTVKDAGDMLYRVKFINNSNVGAPMPDGLNAGQQATLAQLAGLGGLDFDRAYMRSQIEVGQHLQQTFTAYGATGKSPTLRVYAAAAASDYDAQIVRARTVAGSL